MRPLLPLLSLIVLTAACSAPRSYTRATPLPLPDAFSCALDQLEELDYQVVLADTVGGLLQGQRELTGIREAARRGAAAATELITVGLAGGKRIRYDELTVFVYTRTYPQGNTVETTAGLLTIEDDRAHTRGTPSDAARADARMVADRCAPRS
ncbi:MAG: hypothetical protein WD766_12565 [Gemmatimonadota bacterium]